MNVPKTAKMDVILRVKPAHVLKVARKHATKMGINALVKRSAFKAHHAIPKRGFANASIHAIPIAIRMVPAIRHAKMLYAKASMKNAKAANASIYAKILIASLLKNARWANASIAMTTTTIWPT